jgi:hypothetical protein
VPRVQRFRSEDVPFPGRNGTQLQPFLLSGCLPAGRAGCEFGSNRPPDYRDPHNLMGFFSGKLALMDYVGKELRGLHPAAKAFRLSVEAVGGAFGVSMRMVCKWVARYQAAA